MNLTPFSRAPGSRQTKPGHEVRRRGFTLIELLTVIAIIGILAAIIIPTVGKVRSMAKKSNCISNLREIGKMLTLYTNDNKNRLPAGTYNVNGGYVDGISGSKSGAQPRITTASGSVAVLAYALYPYSSLSGQITSLLNNNPPPVLPQFICPGLVTPDGKTNEEALSYTLSVVKFSSALNGGTSPYPTWEVAVFTSTSAAIAAKSGNLAQSNYPLPLSKIWAVSDLDAKINTGFNATVMAANPSHGGVRNRVYLDGSVRSVDIAKCDINAYETP